LNNLIKASLNALHVREKFLFNRVQEFMKSYLFYLKGLLLLI